MAITNKDLISLEIVNFDRVIKEIEEEIMTLAFDEVKDRIDYGTKQLRRVTPVDTGKARKGWDYSIDLDFRGRLRSGTIFNPVEYIDVLNNGHSKQAPSYFIEQTLSVIGLITPD